MKFPPSTKVRFCVNKNFSASLTLLMTPGTQLCIHEDPHNFSDITANEVCCSFFMYSTRAIISRGLYTFYPIFHCGLHCRAINITDNLCTKQRNSSILSLKSAVYNQEQFQSRAGYNGVCTVHI